MGGFWSSSKSIEQQVSYISSSLNHHKTCIDVLVQALESQLHFDGSKDTPVPSGVVKALEYGNEDGSADGKKHEQLDPLERDKITLIKANQSSLKGHVRVVQTSFSTLEEIIQDTTRQLATGKRTDNGLEQAQNHIDKINSLKLQVDVLDQTKNEQQMEIKNLRQENEEYIKEIKNEKQKNSDLESNEASHKNEIKCLNQLLRDQENTTPVQLFYQSRGDTMSKVVGGLKSLLVERLEMDRNKIQFIDCQSEQDVNPEIPMFILCINTSRLGTDVGSAVQKLKGCVSPKVSILIFHHKDVHALPNQSSERVLTGPDFEKLGGIFDLAFLSEKGIYPCDMNDNAANKIVKFLRPKD